MYTRRVNYNLLKPTQLNYTYNNRWGRVSNMSLNLGVKWGTPTLGFKWNFQLLDNFKLVY